MYRNYDTVRPEISNKQKYIDLVEAYGPYKFFATLSFQYALTDNVGIAYASQLVRRLNKKLFGKHYKKHGVKGVTGIAVLEHADIRKRTKQGRSIKDRGSCHFHFLLHGHESFETDPTLALAKVKDSWERAAHGLNYKATKKLVGMNGTDVQLVTTTRVQKYLLKEAWHPLWDCSEHLFYLDDNGLF